MANRALLGYIFPDQCTNTGGNAVIPTVISAVNSKFVTDTSEFRVVCQAVLKDKSIYELTSTSNSPVVLSINGETTSALYVLPDNAPVTTKNSPLVFQDEGLYLITYTSKKLYILPLGSLPNVTKEAGKYVFRNDITFQGSEITLKELIDLVQSIEDRTSGIEVDEDGNVVISGDYTIPDSSISVRDIKDCIDTLSNKFDQYTEIVDNLNTSSGDIEELISQFNATIENVVRYRDDHIVDSKDVTFMSGTTAVSLASFYGSMKSSLDDLETILTTLDDIEDWQELKGAAIDNVVSDTNTLSESIEAIREAITALSTKVTELESASIDTSKFISKNAQGSADVPKDVIFDATTVKFTNPPRESGYTSDYLQYVYGEERQSLASLLTQINTNIASAQSSLYSLTTQVESLTSDYDSYSWTATGTHKLTYNGVTITANDFHIYLCNLKLTISSSIVHDISFVLSRGAMTILSNICTDSTKMIENALVEGFEIEGTRVIPKVSTAVASGIAICSTDESIWFNNIAEVKIKQLI